MLDVTELRKRHEAARAASDSKDKIIMDLLSHVETLQRELQEEKDEVDDRKRVVASVKEEIKVYKRRMEDMQHDQAKLSYVSVLVDGDGMHFHEQFIQGGQDGGYQAARLLIQSVESHIREVDPTASATHRCKIRIYANVEGLTKAYRDANILRADQSLQSFIQGFNKADTLCDFIDAGNGKECADVKLGAHFEQDIIDVHCLRVLFCASADNGYARVLGPHRGSKRISLVKGPKFGYELSQLATHLTTVSFSDVFMSTKVKTSRSMSFGAVTTPPKTPPQNYASVAKAASILPSPPPETHTDLNYGSDRSKIRLVLHRNGRGQRVDPPIKCSSKANVDILKPQKLCNQFHVVGYCRFGDYCTHTHGPKQLKLQQLTDLMYIARTSVCPSGPYCDDVNCLCGHRCPRENCFVPLCKFPDYMHGIDTSIVSTC